MNEDITKKHALIEPLNKNQMYLIFIFRSNYSYVIATYLYQ